MEQKMKGLLSLLFRQLKKILRTTVTLILLLTLASTTWANAGPVPSEQQRVISGTVVDEEGLPLPGVSVVVQGTTVGVVTDIDGNYTLEVPPDARVLVYSFVGMKRQEVNIGNRSSINVTLETEAIGLEEVIAVGYASQKRANIVGSVTSVSGENLNPYLLQMSQQLFQAACPDQ
jgi:hypothetical protein